jgi:PEP-CTERM motif
MKSLIFTASAAVLSLATLGLGVAHAGGVTATLSATYYEVADGSDPDFNVYSTPNVLNGSSLGLNGLPVATAPYGVNDVDPSTGEIEWWSPSLDTNVKETGTGTITLPYSSNMFPPNSTGTNDASFFETAVFSGKFNLAGPGTVSFTLGSDDDSFIYIDGTLIGQNPGVHAVTTVEFTSPTLTSGAHTIEVFYDDRQNVAASLSLSADSDITITPTVPEPATWTMMILGVAGVGGALRRRNQVARTAV